jgi:signal peptidase II
MRRVWWIAVLAFLVDQASKYAVIHVMQVKLRGPLDIFPPLLRFIYGENHGINFGVGGDWANRWVWIALALVVCGWLIWWVRRTPLPGIGYLCAGLVIGGALGNVFDRVVYGYVLDFLNMSCCGFNNPYVFNVADIFIFAGAIGLVFLTPDKKKAA